MLTPEQFADRLREGLNHLQDPGHLRRSSLAALFGVADRSDAPFAVRRILIDAIESLEPPPDEPSQSRAWRIYESLYYRYVQQFSQQEIADQLGISARQLRREQRIALDTLASQLWAQFDMGARAIEGMDAAPGGGRPVADSAGLSEDLAWLKNAPPERPTDLSHTLPAVLDLIKPLADQRGVAVEAQGGDSLPRLAVDPVASRQILLNVLGIAISRASSGGRVCVSARQVLWDVELQVRCQQLCTSRAISDDERASLQMARQLAELCGGKLAVRNDIAAFAAILTLPALEQLPVLAIDDNAGTLQLLRRYAAGTRYVLIGTRDPEEAIPFAEKVSPQVIVLDVMMPHVDGWEILGRLREHPATRGIPIIVCTILAQEELALALGARALLRKPVTRQAFLTALDQHGPLKGTGSC